MANGGILLSKSFSGCWTCRLRHKKCDETRPTCTNCNAFDITCYFGTEKPEWMDGSTQQQRHHQLIKSQIKTNAQRRRDQAARAAVKTQVQEASQNITLPGPTCSFTRNRHPLSAEDVVLATYYWDRIFPIIFPFYDPPAASGGRSWLLELVSHSPVMRKAVVFQSSTLMLEELGANNDNRTILSQAEDLFKQLRAAVNVLTQSSIRAHMHGAARVLACIVQVMRFVASMKCYSAGQLHFDAAIALTKGIFECISPSNSVFDFAAIWNELGPPLSFGPCSIPSAEQTAFKFSLALLIADDILSSSLRCKEPDLLHYSTDLLGVQNPALNFAEVIGCENWVFLGISTIALLNSARHNDNRLENRSTQSLVERAKITETELLTRLKQVEVLDNSPRSERNLATQIWANAALIYMYGLGLPMDASDVDIRHRVDRLLELLEILQPRHLIRNMTWPFFVAGCSCALSERPRLRNLVRDLKPRQLFGNLHVVLQRMEILWQENQSQGQLRVPVYLWLGDLQSSILFP